MNAAWAAWNRFWFAPAASWPLGLCRACFFASFYGLYLAGSDLRWYALFPDGFFQPRSFFAWLSLPIAGWAALHWLVTAFELSVILAALGLLTRTATAVSFVLGLYVIGLQFNYGYLHWAHAVVPIVMGVLALAACGDALSIDALIRKRTTGKVAGPGGQYGWPVQLVRLIFVTVFLAAGLAKLRAAGLSWVTSDTLRHYIIENQYVFRADATRAWSRPLADWLVRHPGLCRVLAGLTLTLELSAPAALVSSRARMLLIPALCLFQVGNALLLYQDFFFAYLGLYAFWVPWPRLRRVAAFPARSPSAGGESE
ncbi:hypothetical protein NKDENANG_00885 [Candidatus Entotheonellaceae bacterium PAL068K]